MFFRHIFKTPYTIFTNFYVIKYSTQFINNVKAFLGYTSALYPMRSRALVYQME